MVKRAICVILVFVISVNSLQELKSTVRLNINSVSRKCAEASGMIAEQLQAAIEDKDIDQINACFFKCYLGYYGLISKENGKETVNIPVTLVFVKVYIPDISFIELLSIGAEMMICAKDFENNPLPDVQPECTKTKTLVKCLAKRKILMNALWLATTGS